MNLYEFFQYPENEIKDIEYLLLQAERFKILNNLRENIFSLGRRGRWNTKFKRIVIFSIIEYLIEKNFDNDFTKDDLVIEQAWNSTFDDFVEKNDFTILSDKQIDELFIQYAKKCCSEHIQN